MNFLRRLLRLRSRQHYAFVDEQGCCRMLCTATNRPRGHRWIEVGEVRLDWIGRPLPHDAILAGR